MLIVTVHDKVAGTWGPPTLVQNKDAAIRNFRSALANKETIMGAHPEDFEMFAIAEWIVPYETEEIPVLKPFKSFSFLANGSDHEKS